MFGLTAGYLHTRYPLLTHLHVQYLPLPLFYLQDENYRIEHKTQPLFQVLILRSSGLSDCYNCPPKFRDYQLETCDWLERCKSLKGKIPDEHKVVDYYPGTSKWLLKCSSTICWWYYKCELHSAPIVFCTRGICTLNFNNERYHECLKPQTSSIDSKHHIFENPRHSQLRQG